MTTTMTKFNPSMGDYDMTVLRILNGCVLGTITPGAAFNAVREDMQSWGYIDISGNVTPKGRDYIRDWAHQYKQVDT